MKTFICLHRVVWLRRTQWGWLRTRARGETPSPVRDRSERQEHPQAPKCSGVRLSSPSGAVCGVDEERASLVFDFFNGAVDAVSEGGHESEGIAVKAVHSELRSIKAERAADCLHAELSASTFGALERLFLVLGSGLGDLRHV